MKQILTIFFVVLFFVGYSIPKSFAKSKTAIFSDTSKLITLPKSTGRINDFENDFSLEQIAELDSIIRVFEKETTNQIAIATIESIEPYTDFADYSFDLFNTWGIGRKNLNNGLLIIISVRLRQARITTGSGTEKILNDAICKKVMDEKILPNFRSSLYFEGTKEALLELIRLWK
jgi:uncharacterized protein